MTNVLLLVSKLMFPVRPKSGLRGTSCFGQSPKSERTFIGRLTVFGLLNMLPRWIGATSHISYMLTGDAGTI